MKKIIIGLLVLVSSMVLESNAQWQSVSRADPSVRYFMPLDTMLGAGYAGKGCAITYRISYGLADTVTMTIQIPNDTTSYCTYFAVRHPFWVGGLVN